MTAWSPLVLSQHGRTAGGVLDLSGRLSTRVGRPEGQGSDTC